MSDLPANGTPEAQEPKAEKESWDLFVKRQGYSALGDGIRGQSHAFIECINGIAPKGALEDMIAAWKPARYLSGLPYLSRLFGSMIWIVRHRYVALQHLLVYM